MRTPSKLLMILVFALLNGCAPGRARDVTDASAERALPDGGRILVSWTDPAEFSEVRLTRNRFDAVRGDWVRKLAVYLQKRADKRLAPEERLEVQITNIDLAGEFEPERNATYDSVRVLRDVYPPIIELQFKRYGAEGEVIAEGERKLRDLAYLSTITSANRSDSLRYEKRLIDDWVRKEFR